MTGRRSSKSMTKTTGRSFGRVMARAGVGLLLLLLVAEGAIVLPEEEKKGVLWLDRGSFSPGRRTTAQRVVGADRAATAATEEEGVVVTEDSFDGAGDHESSVMTQRKIAKGSKKNPLLLFREEVGVSLVAPHTIKEPDLKAKVAEIVLEILNEDLDALRKKIYSFAVQITGMTEDECVEKYSKKVLCHKAFVMIESKEDFKDRFSKLKELLGNVLERYGIVVTPVNKGHYPYVAVTNKTPYDTSGYNIVIYTGWGISCSDDRFDDGAPSGQTWSATSRGFCLVKTIRARLTLHDGSVDNSISRSLVCDDYKSSGTSYSQFYIIMNGDNGCCVQSDHQSGVCPPTDDCVWCSDNTKCCRWNDGDWNPGCPGCPSSRPKDTCVLCHNGSTCCHSNGGNWNSACPGCAF